MYSMTIFLLFCWNAQSVAVGLPNLDTFSLPHSRTSIMTNYSWLMFYQVDSQCSGAEWGADYRALLALGRSLIA